MQTDVGAYSIPVAETWFGVGKRIVLWEYVLGGAWSITRSFTWFVTCSYLGLRNNIPATVLEGGWYWRWAGRRGGHPVVGLGEE